MCKIRRIIIPDWAIHRVNRSDLQKQQSISRGRTASPIMQLLRNLFSRGSLVLLQAFSGFNCIKSEASQQTTRYLMLKRKLIGQAKQKHWVFQTVSLFFLWTSHNISELWRVRAGKKELCLTVLIISASKAKKFCFVFVSLPFLRGLVTFQPKSALKK